MFGEIVKLKKTAKKLIKFKKKSFSKEKLRKGRKKLLNWINGREKYSERKN